MKFKCDENLPVEVAALFCREGHDALSVLDEYLGGTADPTIAGVCRDEERILVTLNLDFASIQTYPLQDYHGIIVLRLARQDRNVMLAIIPGLLALLRTEAVARRLWIVNEPRVRIRGGT